MHQTDILDWDVTDGETTQPPQMVINIVSNDVLQMTVTKTALDVFTNLSQVDHFSPSVFMSFILYRQGTLRWFSVGIK